MNPASILVVEDEEDIGLALKRILALRGYSVELVGTASDALGIMSRVLFDAILLDIGLPDANGLDVLKQVVARDPVCPVIMITGRDDAAHAVKALRLGAADYLTKPAPADEIRHAIEKALASSTLRRRLEAATRASSAGASLVGDSPAWQRTLQAIEAAAASPRTSVLLVGESGSGKELAASMLHKKSERSSGPYVTVNAACFSGSLLESELFGHEAGAFTDARSMKRGLFELANGGTLFLDEVGELPRELQPKLLRVLEGHPFRRVGGEREIRADVRVISATNRRLPEEVAAGRFRADLYQRLRVVEIALPPLRDRGDDVLKLALHFLARLRADVGRPDATLSPAALECLISYSWPGNVRELRNVVERALVLARRDEIRPEDLPPEVAAARRAEEAAAAPSGPLDAPGRGTLDEVVKRHVLAVFAQHRGNVTRSAQALGISRAALRRHLRTCEVMPAEPSRD